MSRSRLAAVLLTALLVVAVVVPTVAFRPEPQRGPPSTSRVASYTDMLLRFIDKECGLYERILAPGGERRYLVLDFATPAADEPAANRLLLRQVGSDFVLLQARDRHQLCLPHGMVGLVLPPE